MRAEWKSLRDWLTIIDRMGELRIVSGAHWDKEMGTITEIIYREMAERAPALLFSDVPGLPKGYRCLYGMLNSLNRLALTLNMPLEQHSGKINLVTNFRKKMKELELIAPEYVASGPVMENIHEGDEADIFEFPIPIHHELDGGRFAGTGDCVVTRDPEEGWINVGTYRMQAIDKDRLISYISPGKHGYLQRAKYFEKKNPCPMVVILGPDPLLWLLSGMSVPYGISEFDWWGGIKDEPLKVIEGKYTGLPIPADAEIAIEGVVSPTETATEGRFGEWAGYYASKPKPEPIFKIKAIYHRDEPILNCAASSKPPHEHLFQRCIERSALIWTALERSGIPDVNGVWTHEMGGGRLFLVISIKQRYLGHSRQAALVASHTQEGAYCNRWTIVVDDDVDPSNLKEVLWAMSTRCDPAQNTEILRREWTSRLDPLTSVNASYNSRIIVDACRPFEHLNDFPVPVTSSSEMRAKTLEEWRDKIPELKKIREKQI